MAFITLSSIQSIGTGLTVLWALKSVSMYHSWTLDELVQDVASSPMLLNENGFALVEHAFEDPSCGNATIWLARRQPDTATPTISTS